MKPVLFLDFDGVLNSHESCARNKNIGIHQEHVAVLNQIVEQAEPLIIISSSWRLGYSLAALTDLLLEAGLCRRVDGHTPKRVPGDFFQVRSSRTAEIGAWLEQNGKPPAFCILDDDAITDELAAYHVRTTMQHGLVEAHVPMALKLLGAK